MKDNIKLNCKFKGLTSGLEEDIKELINKNITVMLDRYFNKILMKENSEIEIQIALEKNKANKFEGSFRFFLDGYKYVYSNDIPFKNIIDLVNHAFQHMKREFADQKIPNNN